MYILRKANMRSTHSEVSLSGVEWVAQHQCLIQLVSQSCHDIHFHVHQWLFLCISHLSNYLVTCGYSIFISVFSYMFSCQYKSISQLISLFLSFFTQQSITLLLISDWCRFIQWFLVIFTRHTDTQTVTDTETNSEMLHSAIALLCQVCQ